MRLHLVLSHDFFVLLNKSGFEGKSPSRIFLYDPKASC
jgi:hypothetical protein